GTGDLGARMNRVMNALPPGPAVIIGSDIPTITPRHIAQAFKRLGSDDAVFGPATDGGYWLVGLKRRPTVPSIFRNVRWSSETALADTLANLKHGQRIALLEELEDVDDGYGYRRWLDKRG
ncbi:MAG: TIGR04282 family arsenosugar biosynthesis glycosyltransferase, partial [Rhodospirillales bacterium]